MRLVLQCDFLRLILSNPIVWNRRRGMDISNLEIIEVDSTPPRLGLTAEEIEALADELVAYPAEFADLYYRGKQAH